MGSENSGSPGDVGTTYIFVRNGTTWLEQQHVSGGDDDSFGRSVAVDGDTLMVGVPKANFNNLTDSGSIWVYNRSGTQWSLAQTLTKANVIKYDYFGQDISLDGDKAIVGAPRSDRGVGVVLIRSGGIWIQQAEVIPPNEDYYQCGKHVAISGTTALVSCSDLVGTRHSPNVYFYTQNGTSWALTDSVTVTQNYLYSDLAIALDGDAAVVGISDESNPNPTNIYTKSNNRWSLIDTKFGGRSRQGTHLGRSIAASGNTIIASAPYKDEGNDYRLGAAYIFVRNNNIWSQQAKLISPNPNDYYADNVALDGDTAVVLGVFIHAYIYVRNGTTWTLQTTLTPPNNCGSFANSSMALEGDTLMLGDQDCDRGAVHVFTRTGTTWTLQTTLTVSDNPEPYGRDGFGYSFAYHNNKVIIGRDHEGQDRTRAFYIFERIDTRWTQQAKFTPPEGTFAETFAIDDTQAIAGEEFNFKLFTYSKNNGVWGLQSTSYVPDLGPFRDPLILRGDTLYAGDEVDGVRIYKYINMNWDKVDVIEPAIRKYDDAFAISIAFLGDQIVVGAPGLNGFKGGIFVYNLLPIGAATKVVFTTQPGGAEVNQPLSPQPVVAVRDANGSLVTTYSGAVTLNIKSGVTSATISNATAQVVNGIASFSNVAISKKGSNYVLMATSGALTSADSQAITITPTPPPPGIAMSLKVDSYAMGQVKKKQFITNLVITNRTATPVAKGTSVTWAIKSLTFTAGSATLTGGATLTGITPPKGKTPGLIAATLDAALPPDGSITLTLSITSRSTSKTTTKATLATYSSNSVIGVLHFGIGQNLIVKKMKTGYTLSSSIFANNEPITIIVNPNVPTLDLPDVADTQGALTFTLTGLTRHVIYSVYVKGLWSGNTSTATIRN